MKDLFHVNRVKANLMSIYSICEKGYKVEFQADRYVIKDITNDFRVVSSGPTDCEHGLYKYNGTSKTNNVSVQSTERDAN